MVSFRWILWYSPHKCIGQFGALTLWNTFLSSGFHIGFSTKFLNFCVMPDFMSYKQNVTPGDIMDMELGKAVCHKKILQTFNIIFLNSSPTIHTVGNLVNLSIHRFWDKRFFKYFSNVKWVLLDDLTSKLRGKHLFRCEMKRSEFGANSLDSIQYFYRVLNHYYFINTQVFLILCEIIIYKPILQDAGVRER